MRVQFGFQDASRPIVALPRPDFFSLRELRRTVTAGGENCSAELALGCGTDN